MHKPATSSGQAKLRSQRHNLLFLFSVPCLALITIALMHVSLICHRDTGVQKQVRHQVLAEIM